MYGQHNYNILSACVTTDGVECIDINELNIKHPIFNKVQIPLWVINTNHINEPLYIEAHFFPEVLNFAWKNRIVKIIWVALSLKLIVFFLHFFSYIQFIMRQKRKSDFSVLDVRPHHSYILYIKMNSLYVSSLYVSSVLNLCPRNFVLWQNITWSRLG